MELRELEAFAEVAKQGSFTRAAEALSLTQPAVTRQILALERELKTRLLDRLGRRVELTAAGETLLPYSQEILRLVDEARQAVADVTRGAQGRLSLGASSTAAAYLLPELLRDYRKDHPLVQLSLSTGPSPQVWKMVESGAVDLGIVMNYREREGFDALVLSDYAISLVVYPGHPLADRRELALLDEPLIVMQTGATLRSLVEKMHAEAGTPLRISMELDNVEAIKKMIEAQLGVAILPEIAVAAEVAEGRLIVLPLPGLPSATQTIAAIYRRDKYVSAAMRDLLRLLNLREQ